MSLFQLGLHVRRSRKLKAYRQARAALDALPDADLADMGVKRWQLGAVARKMALKS